MTAIVAGRRALVLGVALLICACAADGSTFLDPDDLYSIYDSNDDDNLVPQEWNDAFWQLDTNGDGVVSRDELNAGIGAGF